MGTTPLASLGGASNSIKSSSKEKTTASVAVVEQVGANGLEPSTLSSPSGGTEVNPVV